MEDRAYVPIQHVMGDESIGEVISGNLKNDFPYLYDTKETDRYKLQDD